jgi:hypothetical protein
MLIMSNRTMSADDILLWRDGFWCFRIENRPENLRDDNYCVILQHSEEWSSFVSDSNRPPPAK